MNGRHGTFRGYLALVESGAQGMMRSDLLKRIGPEVHAVLARERLLTANAPCDAWECGLMVRGCEREIVENHPEEPKPFLAVCCSQGEDGCEALELDAADIARETLVPFGFARLLQRLLGLEGIAEATATWKPGSERPLFLGTAHAPDDTARDVFLIHRPQRDSLGDFLAARELAVRPTHALIPTGRTVLPEVATRHGAGARVELELLEDTMSVRDGAFVHASRPRIVRLPAIANDKPVKIARARPARETDIAAAIGATSWEQIKITSLDGHTVRIQCGDEMIRRSFIDLGFGGGRREPIDKWKYVLAVCAGRGQFRWKTFGRFDVVKNGVSVVRKLLCEAFGLAENPFHRFRVVDGWRARFQAGSKFEDSASD